MKLRFSVGLIIFSLFLLVIPIAEITQVYADGDELQEARVFKIISTNLLRIMTGMSPSDNISVIIYLETDPNLYQQYQAIWQGYPDYEMNAILDNLMQKLRKVSAEMSPYHKQLLVGNPDAWKRYRETEEKFVATQEDIKADVQRLNELNDASIQQIDVLNERAYAEMKKQVKQKIEQLPNTTVISNTFLFNGLVVETQVGNITTLAAIPDVELIEKNVKGIIVPMYYLYYLPLGLLFPNNGSIGCPANWPYFIWQHFNEASKYKFVLAQDPEMTRVIKEVQISENYYQFSETLEYGTNYFWRVMVVEPMRSDWSATFSFQTEAAPQSSPEAVNQPTSWPPALIIVIVMVLAASVGLITWFVLARQRRIKRKSK